MDAWQNTCLLYWCIYNVWIIEAGKIANSVIVFALLMALSLKDRWFSKLGPRRKIPGERRKINGMISTACIILWSLLAGSTNYTVDVQSNSAANVIWKEYPYRTLQFWWQQVKLSFPPHASKIEAWCSRCWWFGCGGRGARRAVVAEQQHPTRFPFTGPYPNGDHLGGYWCRHRWRKLVMYASLSSKRSQQFCKRKNNSNLLSRPGWCIRFDGYGLEEHQKQRTCWSRTHCLDSLKKRPNWKIQMYWY